MKILLHPSYFPPIVHFVAALQGEVIWETADHYQKQTYRNRAYLYGATGRQLLIVPVQHTGNEQHQTYRDVKIAYDYDWRKQHRKALETNYRSAPFFEFYEDAIAPVFEKKPVFLVDLNLETIRLMAQLIPLALSFEQTISYQDTYENTVNARHLSNAKKEVSVGLEAYPQVFAAKHDFIENLSVLDLLFNEGAYTAAYLKRQSRNSVITGKWSE